MNQINIENCEIGNSPQSDDNEINRIRALVSKKCRYWKYSNSLKYIVHSMTDLEKKKILVEAIARQNPFLAVQIILSMCDDTGELQEIVNQAIQQGIKRANGDKRKLLILLALLELEEVDLFEAYFAQNINIVSGQNLSFLLNNLDCKQLILFARVLAKLDIISNYASILPRVERMYVSKYPILVTETLSILFKNKRYAFLCCYAMATETAAHLETVLNTTTSFLIHSIMNSGTLNARVLQAFVFLKYGIDLRRTISVDEWQILINDEYINAQNAFANLVRKHALAGTVPKEIEILLLVRMGMTSKEAQKCISENTHTDYFKLVGLLLILGHKFENQTEMLEYISAPNNPYQFSENGRINTNTTGNEHVVMLAQKRFEFCASHYTSPQNIINIYFNSAFKIAVNLEHVIQYTSMRFHLDEPQIKHLLSNYVFRAKIQRVNDGSISVRMINVFTSAPGRLSTNKYWINHNNQKYEFKKGDYFYAKFKFLSSVSKKINFAQMFSYYFR